MKNNRQNKTQNRQAQRKVPVCRLCQVVTVQKRGLLCGECEQVVNIGKSMRQLVCETRQHVEEVRDMDGFAAFKVAFEPMLKFSNYRSAMKVKAVSINDEWFARVDRQHPLFDYLEREWQSLKPE